MEATNLAEMYRTPLLDWDKIETRLQAGVTMAPRTATALATLAPGGATRWRF